MNRLTTGLMVLMLTACSSDKFVPDDTGEDSVADVIEDSVEDTEAEVPADTPEESECTNNSDCNDSDSCTMDRCEEGACVYTETCECRNDADCDDGNRCTTNECTPEGNCRTTPYFDLMIEVVEDAETPTITRADRQVLLVLQFTAMIELQVREITWHIGADCSGDGAMDTNPSTGIYDDSGGDCSNSYYQYSGLWDDQLGEDLLRNLLVSDADTGATLQGPVYANCDWVDDTVTVRLWDEFGLSPDESRVVEFTANVQTISNLRSNVMTDSILFRDAPDELCIDAPAMLEGFTRINE